MVHPLPSILSCISALLAPCQARARWIVCLCLLSLFSLAQAAEIGNIRVLSHIGQALKAEIDLTAVTPEEAQSLQVKLALPDVYRLGNIRRNPVLNNVRLQLRQQDQRYVVLMHSNQAILDSYLHIYLEFNHAKGHEVRALTLWLEADPNHPVLEAANSKEDLPHPDGDLAETAAPQPQAAITPTPTPTPTALPAAIPAVNIAPRIAAAHADTLMPRSKIYAVPPHLAAPPVPSAHTATSNQCWPQVNKLQQQAQRCQLLQAENERISGHLGILESKVDVLKRVILEEDAAPAKISKMEVVPSAAPAPLKKTKVTATPIPWKIIGISAAVFVGVAILAFMLLTLRSKRLAQKKRKPAAKPVEAAAEANAEAASAENAAEGEVESASPTQPVKLGKLAALRQRLKTLVRGKAKGKAKAAEKVPRTETSPSLRSKLAKPFVAISEKTRLGWQAVRAKLPKKKPKAEKAEVATEKPA